MRFHTLVIGSGIAGLTAALKASALGSVAVVTKSALQESNTWYAQGGIAAVTSADDDVSLHIADTLAAASGIANEHAVRILCDEGPQRIAELLALGVAFDRDGDELARGMEAAHQRNRVLHAGGDATGAHIETALVNTAKAAGVHIYEHTALVDLIVTGGSVKGARMLCADGLHFDAHADAVILASGGAGQLFERTTNPAVATADGFAAALRAGAAVRDAEFYQFHPTMAALGASSFLVSEAVRGEGAFLVNTRGERFMFDSDERGELAPRDVVARAIAFEMEKQAGTPVFLDARHLGAMLATRFPTITNMCRRAGIDWTAELVPVTPAAHYWMGGVATDLDGRTSIKGLYAVGEVANTGVHGANRLASNSLLEGIVFAHRAIAAIVERSDWPTMEVDSFNFGAVYVPYREELQRSMWDNAGLLRDEHGLRLVKKELTATSDDVVRTAGEASSIDELEDINLALAAAVLVESALSRRESRGAHHRLDFPHSDVATPGRALVLK